MFCRLGLHWQEERFLKNEILNNLSQKYGKSVSQICLRWILQHEVIPIPKSTTEKNKKENIDIFDSISQEDIKIINDLPEMGFSGELPNIWPERLPLKD